MPAEAAGVALTNAYIDSRTIRGGFSSGQRDLDRWFVRDALREHQRRTHRVTCSTLRGNPAPVAFFAVATVVEEAGNLPGFHYHPFGGGHFPALQLTHLAVRREFQGRGIGSTLVGSVIALFAEVGAQIGLPHLILAPIDGSARRFYKELGFAEYADGERMFLPLQLALDAQ